MSCPELLDQIHIEAERTCPFSLKLFIRRRGIVCAASSLIMVLFVHKQYQNVFLIDAGYGFTNLTIQSIHIARELITSIKTLAGCISSSTRRSDI